MEFCPKCGAVLITNNKNCSCARCNYSTKEKLKISTCEKIEATKQIPIVNPKDTQTLPIVGEKCKKCGHQKAFFWTVQTRSGDEAETKFFKCVKCDHTWREYR